MHSPDLQELVLVESGEALRRHFEALNYRRSRFFWAILALISFGALVSGADGGPAIVPLAGSVSLLTLLALVPLRRTERFRHSFTTLLFALFSLESIVWIVLASEEGLAISYAIVVVGFALLLLRLRTMEQFTIAAVATGATVMRWICTLLSASTLRT